MYFLYNIYIYILCYFFVFEYMYIFIYHISYISVYLVKLQAENDFTMYVVSKIRSDRIEDYELWRCRLFYTFNMDSE